MKLLLFSIGLVLVFGFCQVFASSFGIIKHFLISLNYLLIELEADVRSQSDELECQLRSLRLNSGHRKSVNKYLGKIVKAVEESKKTKF